VTWENTQVQFAFPLWLILYHTWLHRKVSGPATCKWYSFLPLGAVVSLFVSQSNEVCRHNTLCCFSTSVCCCCCCCLFRYRLSPETHMDTPSYFGTRSETPCIYGKFFPSGFLFLPSRACLHDFLLCF
jgi:hypothetical protein